jgi:hypothetical protein
MFPPSPVIGPNVTITFFYDGLIPDTFDYLEIPDFTISSGACLCAPDPGIPGTIILAYGGVPLEWDFQGSFGDFHIQSTCDPSLSDVRDIAWYIDPGTGEMAYAFNVWNAGTWAASAVPAPAAALLFGSGLIGLAWFRRRKPLGE